MGFGPISSSGASMNRSSPFNFARPPVGGGGGQQGQSVNNAAGSHGGGAGMPAGQNPFNLAGPLPHDNNKVNGRISFLA